MKKRKRKSNLKRSFLEAKYKKLRSKLTEPFVLDIIGNMIKIVEGDLKVTFNRSDKQFLVDAAYIEYSLMNKEVSNISDETDLYNVMSNAYQRLDATISGILSDVGAKVSCSKGCSYCCHQHIGVTVPSLLMLVKHIDKSCLNNINDFMDYEKSCVFLKNGSCSIYSDRPFACRSFFSVKPALDCKKTYIDLKPQLKNNMPAIVRAYEELMDSITDFVFDSYGYQRIYNQNMIELIKVYFENESFMKKWLNKENIEYGSNI